MPNELILSQFTSKVNQYHSTFGLSVDKGAKKLYNLHINEEELI